MQTGFFQVMPGNMDGTSSHILALPSSSTKHAWPWELPHILMIIKLGNQ